MYARRSARGVETVLTKVETLSASTLLTQMLCALLVSLAPRCRLREDILDEEAEVEYDDAETQKVI